MQSVLRRVARFATSDAPVAILGETGSGKEVVARLLHDNSTRASCPFVPVNVAALPAELLESELFGHGKGAFTGATTAREGLFESAQGGTLFLDEVAELPLSLQAKLLRAVQDGEVRRVGENRAFAVDARIVCATHRDLVERMIDSGRISAVGCPDARNEPLVSSLQMRSSRRYVKRCHIRLAARWKLWFKNPTARGIEA